VDADARYQAELGISDDRSFGELDRADGGAERREEPISGRVHLAASVLKETLAQYGVMAREEIAPGRVDDPFRLLAITGCAVSRARPYGCAECEWVPTARPSPIFRSEVRG